MPATKTKKTSAHQKYILADGTQVKGVTTIIGTHLGWNKSALIAWARKLAFAGIDPFKVRDQAADIGTITHYLIERHLKGVEPDLSEYSPADVDKAETGFLAYLEWAKSHELKTIDIEVQLVSEKYRYGGTLDWRGYIDGHLAIMDYKTGTGVYDESKIQAAAYKQLWIENNNVSEDPGFWLLHLNKEDGTFAPYHWGDLSNYWEIFKCLLRIDQLKNGNGPEARPR